MTDEHDRPLTAEERRERFGDGPWLAEPDRVEWRTALGQPCLIVRNPEFGTLCGYTAVPPGHPMHGCGMAEVHDFLVHGSVTYADSCSERVCHVPAPGEPDDVWWIGFDANHGLDLVPAFVKSMPDLYGPDSLPLRIEYRTIDYMKAQCEQLAKQLAAMV